MNWVSLQAEQANCLFCFLFPSVLSFYNVLHLECFDVLFLPLFVKKETVYCVMFQFFIYPSDLSVQFHDNTETFDQNPKAN